jgi:hypothetical protein
MITYNKKIKTEQDELHFSVKEVDPIFFGSAAITVHIILDEINKQLDEERKFMQSIRPTCCRIFWFTIAAILVLPLFVICCLEICKAQNYSRTLNAIKMKMTAVVNKYGMELKEGGFNCVVGEDSHVTNLGFWLKDFRVQKEPFFLFIKTNGVGMPGNMNMNNFGEHNVFVDAQHRIN